jgi:undecaprenyl-diphosphatase
MLVAASVISGSLLMTLLKGLFGRLRPDAAYADAAVTGLSFPSGHATMSAVIYLTLGALLASTCAQRGQRGYIVGVAAMVALLVGVSRVALGVHWATDVVAGWAFGSGWALLWLLLASRLFGPPGGGATPAS